MVCTFSTIAIESIYSLLVVFIVSTESAMTTLPQYQSCIEVLLIYINPTFPAAYASTAFRWSNTGWLLF